MNLDNNTTSLQEILETVNNLPSASGGGTQTYSVTVIVDGVTKCTDIGIEPGDWYEHMFDSTIDAMSCNATCTIDGKNIPFYRLYILSTGAGITQYPLTNSSGGGIYDGFKFIMPKSDITLSIYSD